MLHLAKEYDLLIIADEIYAELVYDEEYTSMAAIEGMQEKNDFSFWILKSFAMTGWRLGFVCAPPEISEGDVKNSSICINVCVNNCSIWSY